MLIKSADDLKFNLDELPVDDFWTQSTNRSLKMHKIHWYPAKFPAYLVTKALKYATENNIEIQNVVDCFCGCGTTPLETKKLGYNFWGCDINPIATLIARVKSHHFNGTHLNKYYEAICNEYLIEKQDNFEIIKNDRLYYWFSDKQIKELSFLLYSIKKNVPKGIYRDFFFCAFSNILRGCSRWLTKSIKPQIDPTKKEINAFNSFKKQYKIMYIANDELKNITNNKTNVQIVNGNYFKIDIKKNSADVIITSPPYVTSYEYADLHQLSTLWLGFVKDYRELRNGTVGSLYHSNIDIEINLNNTANDILSKIKQTAPNKIKSIKKYFYDIEQTIKKSFYILRSNSMAFFIIGNTQYKGVHVDNAKYMLECLLNTGFSGIEIYKREIGNKILTRFRDEKGKFTKDPSARKVYNTEYIIIARKNGKQ